MWKNTLDKSAIYKVYRVSQAKAWVEGKVTFVSSFKTILLNPFCLVSEALCIVLDPYLKLKNSSKGNIVTCPFRECSRKNIQLHGFQGDRKNILFYIQASCQCKVGDEVHQEHHQGFKLKLDVGTK